LDREAASRIAMKNKKQVVLEFRRAEIIDAARTVFARRGFALGIMDEIAKEAGVAKGTLYLYFRSKDEVFKAVLDHDMKNLKEGTLKCLDEAKGLKEKIRAFALVRLERAEANKEFFRIMDSERGAHSYTRSQYRDWLREPVLRLASAIGKATEKGRIRGVDAEKTAWLIVDMTRGTIQRRLLSQGETPVAADAEFLLDFIWSSLTLKP
jgi:TetR/AcrR family fatty acid metabolism transcriptional regulator